MCLSHKHAGLKISISSAEPNYFVHFAMRYPVEHAFQHAMKMTINELMGSNHHTTILVFPNFFPWIFLSLSSWKRKQASDCSKTVFFSQFASRKRNDSKSFKKIIDSEFVVWWFDPMSSLLNFKYWTEFWPERHSPLTNLYRLSPICLNCSRILYNPLGSKPDKTSLIKGNMHLPVFVRIISLVKAANFSHNWESPIETCIESWVWSILLKLFYSLHPQWISNHQPL